MKITKQQLQQVIREELTKTLNEEYNMEMEVFFDTLMNSAKQFIERTGVPKLKLSTITLPNPSHLEVRRRALEEFMYSNMFVLNPQKSTLS